MTFTPENWKSIMRNIDWYTRLGKDIYLPDGNEFSLRQKNRVYEFVAKMLDREEIPLAKTGPDMDSQRKDITQIIIHHTDIPIVNYRILSAIGFLRQYGCIYAKRGIKGIPVWSGHFRNRKQIFYAYHWVILASGRTVRLLKDSQIGWHAGNWNVNKRSIGIALSGNFAKAPPTNNQIKSLIKLIKSNYPDIKASKIVGHSKIFKHTICPGKLFYITWKENAKL